MSFIEAQEASRLFVSALTVGELRKGVALKARTDPMMAGQLAEWVDTIERTFADRVLPIDTPTARLWGELSADRSRPVIDTLIAATALVRDLTLVTRDASALRDIEVSHMNPWKRGD